MISNYEDYKSYLLQDEIARFGGRASFLQKLKLGDLWRYNLILRRIELVSCKDDLIHHIIKNILKIKLLKCSKTTGWSAPPYVFGPGLCIVHRGTVVVNENARVGKNCRIHTCVNIGADWAGGCPQIGDDVYIGPGAKIFGRIVIADRIAIGANAVVNCDFKEAGITIAGIPAKKVSEKGNIRTEFNSQENLR